MSVSNHSSRVAYWQGLVESHLQSGLSVKDFCAEQTVSIQSFYQWKRRLSSGESTRPKSSVSTSILPVTIVSPKRPASSPIQIITPSGFAIRFGTDTSPELVTQVLQAIQCASQGDAC